MYLKIEVEMFVGVQLKESVEDLIISFFDLLKNVEVFDIVYLKQGKKIYKVYKNNFSILCCFVLYLNDIVIREI